MNVQWSVQGKYKVISTYLQFKFEEFSGEERAVDGSVAPGGGQARCVIGVHMGEKKQPDVDALSELPVIDCDRGLGDDFTIHCC